MIHIVTVAPKVPWGVLARRWSWFASENFTHVSAYNNLLCWCSIPIAGWLQMVVDFCSMTEVIDSQTMAQTKKKHTVILSPCINLGHSNWLIKETNPLVGVTLMFWFSETEIDHHGESYMFLTTEAECISWLLPGRYDLPASLGTSLLFHINMPMGYL